MLFSMSSDFVERKSIAKNLSDPPICITSESIDGCIELLQDARQHAEACRRLKVLASQKVEAALREEAMAEKQLCEAEGYIEKIVSIIQRNSSLSDLTPEISVLVNGRT